MPVFLDGTSNEKFEVALVLILNLSPIAPVALSNHTTLQDSPLNKLQYLGLLVFVQNEVSPIVVLTKVIPVFV